MQRVRRMFAVTAVPRDCRLVSFADISLDPRFGNDEECWIVRFGKVDENPVARDVAIFERLRLAQAGLPRPCSFCLDLESGHRPAGGISQVGTRGVTGR